MPHPTVDAHLEGLGGAEQVDEAYVRRLDRTGLFRHGVDGRDAAVSQTGDAALLVEDVGWIDFLKSLSETAIQDRGLYVLGESACRNCTDISFGGSLPEQLVEHAPVPAQPLGKEILRPHEMLVGQGVAIVRISFPLADVQQLPRCGQGRLLGQPVVRLA